MKVISACKRFFQDPKEIPEVLDQTAFPSINGLRGISIIVVILAHVNSHFGNEFLHHLFAAGIVGVYIFFVISGFLITSLLIKEKLATKKVSLRKFYARRTLRIFPLAYLYLITIAVISFLFSINVPLIDFGLSVLYLANFSRFYNLHYLLHHFWSLAAEEQFYVFIAPLLKLPMFTVKMVLLFLIPITLVSRSMIEVLPDVLLVKLIFDLTRCVDGLVIGSIAAFAAFNNLFPWNYLKRNAEWISITCLLLIILLKSEISIWYFRPFFNHLFYSLFIALLIITQIQPNNSYFYKLLNNAFLIQIGVLSYSLYIWQQLITVDFMMAYFPWNLILLPIIAYCSYSYFEKPFLKLKSKFTVVK